MSNPKPPDLKAISGTARRDREAGRVIQFQVLRAAPPAPNWLRDEAAKEWNRLAPILAARGLLTDATLEALAHLCSLHGKLVQLWTAGECPVGHVLAQYRALINDFCLTPRAQSRARGAEASPGGGANRFAQFGKRPDDA